MSRLIADARLIPIEHVDRACSVLIDSHSLYALDIEAFETPAAAREMTPRDLVLHPGGPWLSHVIQALVLHDVLLVDSACFETDSTVQRAQAMFPDVIKPLFVRPTCRVDVRDRLYESARVFEPPPNFDPGLWIR
jgi:hypothetical protein